MPEASRRGTSRSVIYVVLALALVAGGAYVALGFTAPTGRDVVPGCWAIDYDEMMKTDMPSPPPSLCKLFRCVYPPRFREMVEGFTYRFSPDDLTVAFAEQPVGDPTEDETAREPFVETFGVESTFGDDRATLRVVALRTPPLDEPLAPQFGRSVPEPTKVQEVDDAGAFAPVAVVQTVWAPTEPPFAIELEVVDEDTLRSPSNFLTRWLWGIEAGPLLLRRVDCAR